MLLCNHISLFTNVSVQKYILLCVLTYIVFVLSQPKSEIILLYCNSVSHFEEQSLSAYMIVSSVFRTSDLLDNRFQ